MAIKKPEVEESIPFKTEHEIKVTRAVQFKGGNVVFDMEVNGVNIYGSRIVEGNKGDFVSFPSHKGKDGKYYSYAYVKLNEDEIEDIESQINLMV